MKQYNNKKWTSNNKKKNKSCNKKMDLEELES